VLEKMGCLGNANKLPSFRTEAADRGLSVAISFSIAASSPEYCQRQANECARRAELAIAPEIKTAFKQLEQIWLASADVADEPFHLPPAGPRAGHL
jgi:hypothetical protein